MIKKFALAACVAALAGCTTGPISPYGYPSYTYSYGYGPAYPPQAYQPVTTYGPGAVGTYYPPVGFNTQPLVTGASPAGSFLTSGPNVPFETPNSLPPGAANVPPM